MEELIKALEENEKISNITFKDKCSFKRKPYVFGADCTLSTNNGNVSIFIGIPPNWDLNLFDIYIKDNKFKFIPHMDTNGKLCLFELEASLIDINFRGILNQCISRAVDIINDGLSNNNNLDFIEEFESYWARLKDVLIANIYVPNRKITQMVKCAVENIKKLQNQNYSDYLRNKKKARLCVSDELNDFKNLQYEYSIINGVYVYLEAKDYIFPPDPREEIAIEYVNSLLSLIDDQSAQKLILDHQNLKYLFFEILQPNGVVNVIGVSFDNCVIERIDSNILKISTFKTCRPVFMKNISKDNLLSRVKNKEQYETKRILLLGCGSIGSYVLNELAKSGFEDITVIDNDMLFDENIFRHFLGNKYVGKYKTVAMSEYLNANIPGMKIKTLEALIEDVIEEESIELNDYDYIISAIGNHNVNRWLNKYIYNNHLSIPVIYAWNEVLGIGNHIALIRYGNLGCYECFFGHDETMGILYDKTSYCAKNQKVAKKLSGCGSYLPYGSTVSLKTAGMCVDILKSEIVSPNENNYITSSKGDKLFFLREGLQLSPKYENQINTVETLYGDKFYQKGCKVCKNVN